MCQQVSGEMVTLKETKAWKVIKEGDPKLGPYYDTEFQEDGWSKPVQPTYAHAGHLIPRITKLTRSGYHVLKTREDADDYIKDGGRGEEVIAVQARGKALPFQEDGRTGWAVEQWKPIEVSYNLV